jgi:hypothetical protein
MLALACDMRFASREEAILFASGRSVPALVAGRRSDAPV